MPPPAIKVEVKPIVRIRVRCMEDHADPWLRRLYVVWAAPPPESDPAEETPVDEHGNPLDPNLGVFYSLAQSDAKGYLSPVMNELDPAADATMPLFPDIDYHFYLVRHPAAVFAQEIVKALNADPAAAMKKWGEPLTLKAVLTKTGVDKKKRPVMEGVISVREDPDWFIQNGSSFYGGWALFRDMPGAGSNHADTDIQCRPLFDQVRRLQFHLGRMRYPIGNQWHPYSPEPWLDDAARRRQHARLPGKLYPNEGVFDINTWNCVLRFQREARAGTAMELDPRIARTPTLMAGHFVPLPAAEDRELEMNESQAYISSIEASPGKAFAVIPDDVDTIVEAHTAAAIKQWLQNDLRKPGKILVSRGTWDSWMQEDASQTVDILDAEIRALGVDYGLHFNNAFRDTRMSVISAGPGQVINSIHKSGFAFDMAMSAFVAPLLRAPLHYEKDPTVANSVKWIVYAEADAAAIPGAPLPDHVEYRESITPWKYDADSPDGGSVQPALTKPGVLFLNFTKVCDHFLLRRISAHAQGWQGKDPVRFTLDSAESFALFAVKFVQELEQAPNAPQATATVDGQSYLFSLLADTGKYLNAWRIAARAFDPTPDVFIDPWTKEGEKFIRALRGKVFEGKKIRVSVIGHWTGGEGSEGFPDPLDQTPPPVSSGTITLGPAAEFPTLYSFVAGPVTVPALIQRDSVIELPGLGHPAHLEWWHFQYEPGYKGYLWSEILDLIGWTPEGLLGKSGKLPIFGLYGMGYLQKHLDARAS